MLSHFLVSQMFSFLLVFCRTGSAMMLLPGFGEAYVPVRVRLLFALMVSLTLSPVLTLPAPPEETFTLIRLLTAEIIIGLFIGGISRLLIATMQIAGSIIALESSMASSLTQNITSFQGQDTSLGNLLSMTAVVLIFATDLHHLMLQGIASSYDVFLPGVFPPVEDIAGHATKMVNGAFQTALQLAAPNIVIGVMIYSAAGILTRLMPNLQLLAVIAAPQLLLSFFIIMISISSLMLWYMDYFRTTLGAFLTPS